MPQQNLDGAQVGPRLEQVRGEAMPQHMRADGFAETGLAGKFLADLLDPRRPQPSAGFAPGEQQRPRLAAAPIDAQQLEKLGREHHLARLLSFAAANLNDHPLAVDVAAFQPQNFIY